MTSFPYLFSDIIWLTTMAGETAYSWYVSTRTIQSYRWAFWAIQRRRDGWTCVFELIYFQKISTHINPNNTFSPNPGINQNDTLWTADTLFYCSIETVGHSLTNLNSLSIKILKVSTIFDTDDKPYIITTMSTIIGVIFSYRYYIINRYNDTAVKRFVQKKSYEFASSKNRMQEESLETKNNDNYHLLNKDMSL